MVNIWQENSLGEGGTNVLAGAAVTVAACANLIQLSAIVVRFTNTGKTYLVVERAIHTVLLGTEDVRLL